MNLPVIEELIMPLSKNKKTKEQKRKEKQREKEKGKLTPVGRSTKSGPTSPPRAQPIPGLILHAAQNHFHRARSFVKWGPLVNCSASRGLAPSAAAVWDPCVRCIFSASCGQKKESRANNSPRPPPHPPAGFTGSAWRTARGSW